MQNFFTSTDNFTGTRVHLLSDEHHHATRSCRVKVGEVIGVTDGQGRRVHARIESIGSRSLTAVIEQDVSEIGEPEVKLTLALSVIKPARFETAIEKCTELGVRKFIPILAKRCEPNSLQRLKINRLGKITREAAKQSGRSWIPHISSPCALADFLERADGLILAASQKADKHIQSLCDRLKENREILLVIGPEGDFTDDEYRAMDEAGAVLFSMGELILRTETAAITATALVVNMIREHRKKH